MHQAGGNSDILCEPTSAREADLFVTSLAQVSETHTAVAAGATEQETLRYHLVTGRDVAYPLSDGHHLTRPFMTRNNGIAIVAFWPDAPVEFHIAAADADRVRANQYILRAGRWLLKIGHDCFARTIE